MKLSDFKFELPESQIAQYPCSPRSHSRLLQLQGNEIAHHRFDAISDLLSAGDLLVFNDTKVIRARLFGHKASGGKVEVLLERLLDEHRALVHLRASKAPKPGTELILEQELFATVVNRHEDLFELQFNDPRCLLDLLEQYGHIPLPPYLNRPDGNGDAACYQTVYARHQGAVAAPTAGLHFDEELLAALAQKGINSCFVTLHVGAGTFQPVRVENIDEHEMHSEMVHVSQEVCDKIAATKAAGKQVIAVGTTSVRSLESASQHGKTQPFHGETRMFIYPGYQFQCVDAMITNFHLPESSLLMLVCAFSGYEPLMAAYQEAISNNYRFYSYGDAMLLQRGKS